VNGGAATPAAPALTRVDLMSLPPRVIADVIQAVLNGQVPLPFEFQIRAAGRAYRLTLEEALGSPAVGPPPSEDELSECERDIVALLEEAGQRLTGSEIRKRLGTFSPAKVPHGDTTITHALADLVQRKHVLNNKKDSYGKGYGLADWS
jgi:hypothetical protein